MSPPPIAFIDLDAQRRRLGPALEDAVLRVVRSGRYIMGPEIEVCERALAEFCGARHALTCANGTDALALALMAKNVKARDAVLVPAFTFAATAEVVAWLGAHPVFIDSDPVTFNMDPAGLPAGLAAARAAGLNPVGVIPVGLFGQPADYDAIAAFCAREGLWMIDDAAQSFGAEYRGRKIGTIGDIAATSFFPAKPLGCYGDGGAVFFEDPALLEPLTSFRVHGQGTNRYDNVRIGMNARMDTIQAAVIIEKLKVFGDEIVARNRAAARYGEGLAGIVATPAVAPGSTSVWAQYTVRVGGGRRDALQAALKESGIPTAIYYSVPLHRQPAYRRYPVAGGALPVCDMLAGEVISLPMHPYLDAPTQDRIVAAVKHAVRG
jgi:dTDP-4-amino-4,6-dideoxygalactose transaminase